MKNKIYRIKIILLAILAIIVFYWIWIQSVNFYVEQIYIPEHKLTQTYKSITVSLADPITKTAGRKILQGLEIRGSIEKLIERTGIIIHEVPDQAINRAGRLYKKVFGDTGETISAKRGSNTLRQDRYVPEEGDLVVRETSTGEVRVFRENPSNEILREPMPPGRIAEVKKGAEEVTTGLEALGRKQVKDDGTTVDYVWDGAVARAVAANGKADEATGLVKLYEKDPITGKVAKDPITGEDAPFFLKKETLDGRVYPTKNVNFNNRDPEAALNRETFPGATQVLDGGKRGYGYKGEEMPSSLLPKDSTLILEPRQKTDAIKLDSSSMVGKNGELPPKMTDWVTESGKVVQSAEDDQALLGVYAARTNFKNKNGEIVNDKVEKYGDIFLANKKTLEERALEKEGLLEAIDNHTKKLYKWTLENMEDSPIDMLNQLADQRSLSAKFPQEYKDWLGKFADDPEIFSKDAFENFLRKYVDPSSGNDPAQIARKIDELLTRDGISDSVKNQLVQARENLLRENPNIFSPRAATLEAKSAATEKAEKSAAMLSSALGVTDESENEKLSPQEVAQATQERAIEDAASGKKEPLPGAFEETPTSLATTREVNEKIYQELQGGIENYKKSLVQNVPDEYKDYFLNYVEKNPGQPVTALQRPDNYVNNLLKSAGIYSPELKAAIENYDRATELGLIMASQNFRESLKPQTKGEWVGSVAALGVMPESLLLGLALAPVVEKVVKETVDYTANQNPKSHKENGSPYIWDINNEKEKLSGLRKQLLEHDLGVTSLSEEQITGIKEKIGESYKKIAKAEIEMRKEPFIYAGPEDLPGKDPGPDISKINEPAEEAARLTTEQISPETAAKIIKETSGEREKIADRSYKGPEDFWGLAENKFTKPVTDTLFGFEPFYKEEKNDYGLPKIPDNPYKPSTGASTQSAEEWQNFVAENYNEGENGSQEKPFSCKECEKGDNLLTSMFEFDKNTNELKLKENWRDLAKIKGRGAYFHFPSKQKILEKMVQQKLITQDQMNAAMNKSATDVTLPNGTKVINKDTNQAKTFNENPDKNKNETNKVNFSDQDIMPE